MIGCKLTCRGFFWLEVESLVASSLKAIALAKSSFLNEIEAKAAADSAVGCSLCDASAAVKNTSDSMQRTRLYKF